METNICDINHLDSDVLLPPRKRLLAGFIKQTCDGDAALHTPVVPSSSSSASPSPASPSMPQSPFTPTASSPSLAEFQARLNNFVTSHFNNARNLSPQQIVEASKSVADSAVKVAETARTAAQEKAILAAKAVAAAKDALALVAAFPEEVTNKERCLKRNKSKKHVQVQLLYEKHQPVENYRDDEELARKLHQVINSSPRISKNSSSSDGKGGHRNKKLRTSPTSERAGVSSGSIIVEVNSPSMCNGHAVARELDSEDSIQEGYTSTVDKKASHVEMDNGEVESSHMREKMGADVGSPAKKRGRLKPKKLPLSLCNSKDQANPKEDTFPRGSPLTDKNMGNLTTSSKSLLPVEPSVDRLMRIEATPTWKCQDFKAPVCIKQNKVLQS